MKLIIYSLFSIMFILEHINVLFYQKIRCNLKKQQKQGYENTKVILKVNGNTYSAKTNSKGQPTIKINKLTKKGKFTATIKYAGNKYYNAKTVKAKITI